MRRTFGGIRHIASEHRIHMSADALVKWIIFAKVCHTPPSIFTPPWFKLILCQHDIRWSLAPSTCGDPITYHRRDGLLSLIGFLRRLAIDGTDHQITFLGIER
jgi:hypothetical protein